MYPSVYLFTFLSIFLKNAYTGTSNSNPTPQNSFYSSPFHSVTPFPSSKKPTTILTPRKLLILWVLNTQKVVLELLTHTTEKNNSTKKSSNFIYSSFCPQPEDIMSKYRVQKSNHFSFFFTFLYLFLPFLMWLLI